MKRFPSDRPIDVNPRRRPKGPGIDKWEHLIQFRCGGQIVAVVTRKAIEGEHRVHGYPESRGRSEPAESLFAQCPKCRVYHQIDPSRVWAIVDALPPGKPPLVYDVERVVTHLAT